ncbi:hypothetical protein KQI84_19385 [bacterium]|nr:hypothetical protein [bacterium]
MAAFALTRPARLSLLAFCISFLLGVAAADSPPDSGVIRVSKDSAQYLAPYHYGSIQAAIDDLPSALTTPTLILVYPGTYEEGVTIDRRNLSIVGAEAGAVVLSSSGTTSTLTIALPAGSVGDVNVIEALRIEHDGTSGGVPVDINSINATGGLDVDLRVHNCVVESAGGDAVTWAAAGSTVLSDCDLQGVGGIVNSSSVPTGGRLSIRGSRLALTSSANGNSAISADETIDTREVVFSAANAGTHSGLTAFSGAAGATVTVALGTVLDSMTWGDGVVFNNVDAGQGSNLNADYLDSLDSTQFLRSDAADTATGAVTFSGALLSPGSGSSSFKIGNSASASGAFATALGNGATAALDSSTAVGHGANGGEMSTALGKGANATGTQATAVGYGALTSGSYGTALGSSAKAKSSCVAIGRTADAGQTDSNASVAIGSGARAEHDRSISIGNNALSTAGDSIALGHNADAAHSNAIALGTNVTSTANYEIRLGGTSHMVSVPGELGVGVVNPVERFEVYNGAISIGSDSYSTPTAQANRAKFFVNQDENNASVTAMWVMDSAGNTTQLSSHATPFGGTSSRSTRSGFVSSFDDPTVDLPWSFHHANRLTGDAAVVDMAKLVQWVEQKMQEENSSAQLVYEYQLPEEKMISKEDWEVQAFLEAAERELAKAPWILVSLESGNVIPAEAYESIPEYETTEIEETYTDFIIDDATMTIVPVTKTRIVNQEVPTGAMVNRLKSNYVLRDGQLYRRRTIDDLDLTTIAIPELPAWIDSRIDTAQ